MRTTLSHHSLIAAALIAGAALVGVMPLAQGAESSRARLQVTNRSAELVDLLQVSPSESQSWADDLLGRLQILPGGGVAVNFEATAGCRQDVRVVFHNGTEETRMGVDACAAGSISFDGSAAIPVQRQRPRG